MESEHYLVDPFRDNVLNFSSYLAAHWQFGATVENIASLIRITSTKRLLENLVKRMKRLNDPLIFASLSHDAIKMSMRARLWDSLTAECFSWSCDLNSFNS